MTGRIAAALAILLTLSACEPVPPCLLDDSRWHCQHRGCSFHGSSHLVCLNP